MTTTTATIATTFTIPIIKRASTIPSPSLNMTASSGKRWTADEDRLLLQYASTKSHEELAKNHKRTVLAIRMRLMTKLHNKLDGMNYFSNPELIQSVYDLINNDENVTEIRSLIIRYGSPSYEEIRTFHQMMEHKRKCASNRRLINNYSPEPKLLDMTLTTSSSSAFLNRFVATPVIKEILSFANTN